MEGLFEACFKEVSESTEVLTILQPLPKSAGGQQGLTLTPRRRSGIRGQRAGEKGAVRHAFTCQRSSSDAELTPMQEIPSALAMD